MIVKQMNQNKMKNKDKLLLAQKVTLIAGVFCSVVALLLILNFWQMTKADPIESAALEALVERLKDDPNNEELKSEIRHFDLLARKAYFNSQWQVKTGAYLLLIGAIVLAFALRVYYSAKSKIDEPDEVLESEIAARIMAQKGIVVVGLVVMVLALLASFFTVNHLDSYNEISLLAETKIQENEEIVEVINLVPADDSASAIKEETAVREEVTSEQVSEGRSTVSDAEEHAAQEDAAVELEESTDKQPETQAALPTLSLEELQKNYNSFRGPFGLGVSNHKNIPTDWDGTTGDNILWKAEVPKHGFNSPIIWGDKLFVAGADDTSREVYCYNRNNGKLLWTALADNIPGSPATPPRVTDDTGLSAPTMTTDGTAVFAIFGTGDVIALDMNGKRLWAKNLGVPDNHYGHSSSLITWNEKLFVQYDTNRGGKVMALHNKTGETVWETQRSAKISWASPVLAELDGKYQLLLTADPIVAGYDIETGEELWTVECMMGEVGPSLAYSNGIVAAANEYAQLVAIDIRTREILWSDDYYLPEAASLLAHNGLLFLATSYGVFVCYDLKEGELLWEDDFGSQVYSSPVLIDGKVYLMDNDGVMRIYAFSREMKKLGENQLGEMAGPTPASADGRIYIRGEKHVFCIGSK